MAYLVERLGPEIQANTTTTGAQTTGKVATFADGTFVIVWNDSSHLLGDANTGIVAQRFDATGNKLGGEILVNVTTTGLQTGAAVAALSSGDFVVTWTDPSGAGGDADSSIKMRIFHFDGTPLTGEILANTVTLGTQAGPAVASITGGRFVIAWQDLSGQGGDASSFGIKAQMFDNAGNKVGGEFLANTTTSGAQVVPSVAGLADGNFAIGWLNSGGHGAVQLFDPAAAKVGGEVDVVSGTPSFVEAPLLAALDSGFVAAWREASTSDTDIRAQLFDAGGAKVGAAFTVNDDLTGDQFLGGVTGIPGHGFAVEWNTNGAEADVYGSIYEADGSKSGVDFVLDATPAGAQTATALAAFTNGDLIGVFTDGISPATEIRAQRLTESTSGATSITLSNYQVSETAINNLPVATISASGPALNAEYTFSIASDSSGGAFGIGSLIVLDNFLLDFETAPQVLVVVRAETAGISYEQQLAITIDDANIEVRRTASDVTTAVDNDGSVVSLDSLTPLDTGGYLIVNSFLSGFTSGLTGRVMDAAGQPTGTPFSFGLPPLATTANIADTPGVGFLAVYDAESGGRHAVGIQRYDDDGQKVGTEEVLSLDDYTVHDPRAAVLGDGNAVVMWVHQNADSTFRTFVQKVTPTGAPIGESVPVEDIDSLDRHVGDLAVLPDGRFVAIVEDVDNNKFLGQLFDADLVKIGDPFNAGIAAHPIEGDVSVVVLETGEVIVGWTEKFDGSSGPVMEQKFVRLAADGTQIGGVEVANHDFDPERPADLHIVKVPGGGFLMTWTGHLEESNDPNETVIFGEFFDAENAPVGGQFRIGSDRAGLEHDAIAGVVSGKVVIAWQESFEGQPGGNISQEFFSWEVGPTEGADVLHGTNAGEVIDLSKGGHDTVFGEDGDDGFLIHPNVDQTCRFDGGPGFDEVGAQGNFGTAADPFVLGPEFLLNIEELVFLPGNDTRFGDDGGEYYSYHVKCVDENVPAGQTFYVNWNTLRAGEGVTFDGSAETDGSFITYAGKGVDEITGGQQDDGFYFGYGNWGPDDVVDGQGGTLDQLGLQGNYSADGAGPIVFGATQLTGIEMIVCLTGGDTRFGAPTGAGYSYELTMNDGNVAAGETMYISANTLHHNALVGSDETITFNGVAETDGHFVIYGGQGPDDITGGQLSDTVFGGLGPDLLRGGGGPDVFLYTNTSESTPDAMDRIDGFSAGCLIDLRTVDANALLDGIQSFNFILGDPFSGAAGELRGYQSGDEWFVAGDVTGDGLADFQIELTNFTAGMNANIFWEN